MEMLNLLRQAIDYIEDNLQNNIKIDDVAKAAALSKYHFQRMFHVLTGFTITEYVRNRRLTLVAEELTMPDAKVIDIALKYGYETPESFAKAFQRLHGVTPLMVKKNEVKLKAFPRLSFQIQIKGETEMNYRIVKEPASIVIGKAASIGKEPYKEIPEFALQLWQAGVPKQINIAANKAEDELLNGYHFDFNEDGTRKYMMGTEIADHTMIPEDWTLLNVPAQTYAVFDSSESMPADVEIGIEITNVWKRIYSEWFPSSQFEQAEGPCLEKYQWTNRDQGEYICEVWIPVQIKG